MWPELSLMKVMDDINLCYGAQMIKPAIALRKPKPQLRFKYPVLQA